eukprot:TRINITY_DN1837_c0_g1_i1.p1 TRINITY_DN1837_c0_g1~~TRINITY_DN1837_c0_g1_i1.p1  ORF type:complete len:404 (+),score=118.14 TRINITY_DN1837_c0_g1_i1:67-1278(+)
MLKRKAEEPARSAVELPDGSPAAMVMDMGAYQVRAGKAGAPEPSSEYLTLTAVDANGSAYIGDALQAKVQENAQACTIRNPAPGGRVEAGMEGLVEKLWAQAWRRHNWHSDQRGWVHTSPPGMSRTDGERAAELVFEGFRSPQAGWIPAPQAALFGVGCVDGIALDVGEATTRATPAVGGRLLRYASVESPAGGRLLGACWRELLGKRAVARGPAGEAMGLDTIAAMGLTECAPLLQGGGRAAFPHGDEALNHVKLPLPTGETLALEVSVRDCLTIGEALFRPRDVMAYLKPSLPPQAALLGAHEVLLTTLQQVPRATAHPLVANVVVCGGVAAAGGFADRLAGEVEAAPSHLRPTLRCPEEPETLVWRGAALMAALPEFKASMITREEYMEHGASIVHARCR